MVRRSVQNFYFFKKSHSYHDLSVEKISSEIDVLKTYIIWLSL